MGNIKFATESRNGIDGFSIQYNDYPKSYYFGGVENLSSDADEIFFQKEGKFFIYNITENNILINGTDVTANGASAIKTQLESDIFPVGSSGPVEVTVLKEKKTLTNDEIKALPTIPFELVPAPGEDKLLFPFAAIVRSVTNVGYTNISPAANFTIGQDFGAVLMSAAEADGSTVSTLLNDDPVDYLSFFGLLFNSTPIFPNIGNETTTFKNTAINVLIYNAGAGNLTGGDAANRLEITVLYSIVDL